MRSGKALLLVVIVFLAPTAPAAEKPSPTLRLTIAKGEVFEFTERVVLQVIEVGWSRAEDILVVTEGSFVVTEITEDGCRKVAVTKRRLHGHHDHPKYGRMEFDSEWEGESIRGRGEPKRGPSRSLATSAGRTAAFTLTPRAVVTLAQRPFSTPGRRRGDQAPDPEAVAALVQSPCQRLFQVLPEKPIGRKWTMKERVAPFYLCHQHSKFGVLTHSLRVKRKDDETVRATIKSKGRIKKTPEDAHKHVAKGIRRYDLRSWVVSGEVVLDRATGLLRERKLEQSFVVKTSWCPKIAIKRVVETTCRRQPEEPDSPK